MHDLRSLFKRMVGEVPENGLEAELDGELGYGRQKDVLGMYVGENESAKYWLQILNGLKNHGDILIICIDGFTGFPEAISAVYPKTEIQQCMIHQIRNSTKYVSYKDILWEFTQILRESQKSYTYPPHV